MELLQSLRQSVSAQPNPPPTATFTFDLAAELTQYVTPLGGSMSWIYANNAYAGNVILREVTTRSMNQGAGGFTNSHTLSHPSTCDTAGGAYHACTQILDSGACSKKIYYSAAQGSLVLPSQYQETDNNGTTLLLQKNFTWGLNAAGNAFVSRIDSTLNPGSSNRATTSTVQSLDAYGNLTQQQVYDYGSATVSRTYNLAYLTDANYVNRYIRNRLTSATVTANGIQTSLKVTGYDGTGLGPLQLPKDQWGDILTLSAHDSAYDTTLIYRGNSTSVSTLGSTMTYAYDIGGNPYKIQDGNGMVVSVSSDSSTSASLPAVVTPNGNLNLTSNMTYSATYALTSVSGANGANQTVSYDGYNRPTQAVSVDDAITVYSYAYAPNTQTATINTTVNNNTTTQWRRTTFDGFGRTIKVETGHDGTTYNTVDTVYGACGCSPLGKVMRV